MIIESIISMFRGVVIFIFSVYSALIASIIPIKEEYPHLMDTTLPTPTYTEENKQLTPEEQSTMSGSFIKEFESMISSRSGSSK